MAPHKKRTLLAGHPLWPLYTPCRLLAEHPLRLPQKCRSSNALGSARNSLSQPISFSSRLQASHPRPKALGCRLIAPAPVPNYGSRLQALALCSRFHFTNPISILSATLSLPTLHVSTVRRSSSHAQQRTLRYTASYASCSPTTRVTVNAHGCAGNSTPDRTKSLPSF